MAALLQGSVDSIDLSDRDAGLARRSGSALAGVARGDGTPMTLRVTDTETGREIEAAVPAGAWNLLVRALAMMADGHSVALMPTDAELSTQRAADLLGVSRPYFVKLLDEGQIPFRKVGTQRRVRLESLRRYMAEYSEHALPVLQEMVAEGQRMGLYE